MIERRRVVIYQMIIVDNAFVAQNREIVEVGFVIIVHCVQVV